MKVLCCLLTAVLAGQGDLRLSLLGRHDLTCPVCRQTFTTVVCTQTNTRGGVDRDLFARALGPQPEFYRISTCPACGYSGYRWDFDRDVHLPRDVRQKISGQPELHLPPGFTPDSDPRELDAADRYDLAITCYRWRKKSDEALAWLHLRASWIERDKGAVLARNLRLERVFQYIERWRPTMHPKDNQVDVEMQLAARIAEALAAGRFNRYQRLYVELALALILRRHGENRHAWPTLDRLAGLERFSASLRKGIERMRLSIVAERKHQQEAARCFERALLADQIKPAHRGAACYLLGELYRRLGGDGDAIRWYDKALDDPALPADLQTWARRQREWSAAGSPPGNGQR